MSEICIPLGPQNGKKCSECGGTGVWQWGGGKISNCFCNDKNDNPFTKNGYDRTKQDRPTQEQLDA